MVGFDFTSHVRRLCADMVTRLESLQHIDLDQIAIRFCQTRAPGPYGVQASLTPLRFAGGAAQTRKRGRLYTVGPVFGELGQPALYLLSFYLPRYLNRPFRDKLNTVLHELWHIGPAFDGDLRRHEGRCYAHTSSQKEYNRVIDRLTDQWLALDPPEDLYAFLRFDFHELTGQHGAVFGRKIPTPRLIPVTAAACRQDAHPG